MGDDAVIKNQKAFIGILLFIIIGLLLYIGVFTFLPKNRSDVNCTFRRTPWYSNRLVSFNMPSSRIGCHG
jgi:hypothetical protein